MSAALEVTHNMEQKAHLWCDNGIKLPYWVVSPEDPQFAEEIQRSMGTIILPSNEVISHFSIFKCLFVPSGGGGGGGGVSKSNSPSIDVLTSNGNHSGILMCSNHFPDGDSHTKAYFMFRPMVSSPNTWCSTFQRISNSIGVAQLAYGKFIEVFDKYFVTGTFTSTQLEELFRALNASIDEGRDIFTNKIRHLLTRFRNKKAKEEQQGWGFKDYRTYQEFINFITDILRNDLLEVVGPSFQVGSLATLKLTGNHDTYATRNDGGIVTETFKRAAYNSFIIITVTTTKEVITIQLDIDRSSFRGSGRNKISFWNGQLNEYTTTDPFIQQVIDKLAAVVAAAAAGAPAADTGPGGEVDARAARMAHEALLQIVEKRKKGVRFGSNTAITTGCQVPMLFYYNQFRVDVVFPPRLRDSDESVVATDRTHSSETGYTGYYILCPKFFVPFSILLCNKVLFFCNCTRSKGWFNFPNYDFVRSEQVIGDNEGDDQNSINTEKDPHSQPPLLSSPSSSPGSPAAASFHSQVASAPASASISRPVSASDSGAAASGAALLDVGVDVDVEVEVGEPKPPSFFRSIFNKCVSYFFSARVGDIRQTQMNGDITQTQTLTNIFDDGLNVDKLLIRNALELADDVDRAQDKLLVHAVHHALDAVFDLIHAFELNEKTNTELQVMIDLATAAANNAPAAQFDMLKNCVHVAAFAVRGVACICACENALGQCLSFDVSAFSKLLQSGSGSDLSTMKPVAELALRYNQIVIQDIKDIFGYSKRAVTSTREGEGEGNPKRTGIGIGGRLRSRRDLHRVSRKQQRTLKKKNLSRKYSKYSSGCDSICSRSLRRSRRRSLRRSLRRSYSRKISNNN